LDFYQAGLDAYKGERELWAEKMNKVLSEDGSNPYYAWFVTATSEGKIASSGLLSHSIIVDRARHDFQAVTSDNRNRRRQVKILVPQ